MLIAALAIVAQATCISPPEAIRIMTDNNWTPVLGVIETPPQVLDFDPGVGEKVVVYYSDTYDLHFAAPIDLIGGKECVRTIGIPLFGWNPEVK